MGLLLNLMVRPSYFQDISSEFQYNSKWSILWFLAFSSIQFNLLIVCLLDNFSSFLVSVDCRAVCQYGSWLVSVCSTFVSLVKFLFFLFLWSARTVVVSCEILLLLMTIGWFSVCYRKHIWVFHLDLSLLVYICLISVWPSSSTFQLVLILKSVVIFEIIWWFCGRV